MISSSSSASSWRKTPKTSASTLGSGTGSNNDAAASPFDSTANPAPSLASSCKRTCVGSSSQTSSHVATSLAPCFINVLGPHAPLLVTLPGTAYTSRFCSIAQRAVTRVPLCSPASTTSTPTLTPLNNRLRRGKFCGAGKVPSLYSETIAPPPASICSASALFSLG